MTLWKLVFLCVTCTIAGSVVWIYQTPFTPNDVAAFYASLGILAGLEAILKMIEPGVVFPEGTALRIVRFANPTRLRLKLGTFLLAMAGKVLGVKIDFGLFINTQGGGGPTPKRRPQNVPDGAQPPRSDQCHCGNCRATREFRMVYAPGPTEVQ